MGFGSQLWLLSWKNFTLRKRQKFRLVAEIFFPLALFLILVIVRTRPDLKIFNKECHFDGKAMPSAGTLPFIQSYVCTISNTCHDKETEDEQPGVVGTFNQSLLTKIVEDVEKALRDNTIYTVASLLEDIETFSQLFQRIQDGSTTGNITVGNLVTDPSQVIDSIQSNDTRDAVADLLASTINFQMLNVDMVNQFLQDVLVCQFNGQNLTLEELNFQSLLCVNNSISPIFVFGSDAIRDLVSQELCGNSSNLEPILALLLGLQQEIDVESVLEEIAAFALANTNRSLNIGGSSISQVTQLIEDLNNRGTIGDLQTLAQDFVQLNLTTPDSVDLGTVFCGRPNSLLSTGTGGIAGAAVAGFSSVATGSVVTNQGSSGTTQNMNTTLSQDAPVCKALNNFMWSSQSTRIIWRQLKPLLYGKILYYPDTPAVRKIITKANRTFDDLYRGVNLAFDFSYSYYFTLYDYLNNSANIDFLRTLSGSCLCDLAVERLKELGIAQDLVASMNGSICEFLSGFLNNGLPDGYDWRNAINSTRALTLGIANLAQCFDYNKYVGYNDKNKMMRDGIKMIDELTFWAALEFSLPNDQTNDQLPSHIEYKIRMDTEKVDSTSKIRDRYWRPGARGSVPLDTKYLSYGFAYLQDMIDHAIIDVQTGRDVSVGVVTQQFPYPCYTNDRFIFAISRSLPLFLTLAWVLSVAMICKSIVYEKENRLKEVMKIMGLSNAVHWVAWFINAFIMMFLTILVLVMILKGGNILEFSDASVIIVFLTAFAISTIMECFLFSVFFSRANLSACVAGFLYFILYLPYTLAVQWEEYMTTGHKVLSSLSAGVSFGWGCSYIARYEEQAVGIQWYNIADSPMVDDGFSMAGCIMMMFLDAFIYGVAMWYIEAVFPGQYGVPRPFYFPFQKSYWCGTSDEGRSDVYRKQGMELDSKGGVKIEAEPKDRRLGVSIQNLKKVYREGKKVAVDGLSINFYEGHITSFLGHNGAGKTTTMSVLTGMFRPTEGTAYIYGHDIRSDMDGIRRSLGMCPQHNVLFDGLTVEEHLWFFARLKGLEQEKTKREMEQMIKDVGLPHKRKELSSSLSGGMKRKLSVAIAFVGNAKTVILDEPTAGVDPYARRSIWDLLLKLKRRRTIILSTHHMDEADVLGDRIAIISNGKLCCCGSSLFLKSEYGSGYYLTMVRGKEGEFDKNLESDSEDDDDMLYMERPGTASSVRTVQEVKMGGTNTEDEGYADSNSQGSENSDPVTDAASLPSKDAAIIPGFSEDRVTAFIQKSVKSACLVETTTTELTYQIPENSSTMGKMEKLFKELEKNHKSLGISSFGVSDTSLEEVFLRVAEQNSKDDLPDEFKRKKLEDVTDGGRFARPVTRLSFRRKKKKSLLKQMANRSKYGKAKIESEDLLTDSESVASVPVSEFSEEGFNHEQKRKRVEGPRLILRQFIALFIKRFHRLRRSKKGFFFEILLPAFFVLLAMVFAEIRPPTLTEPPLELHPWHYVPTKGEEHLYTFFSNDAKGYPEGDNMVDQMLGRPGPGNRCMDPSIKTISEYPCTGQNSGWMDRYLLQPGANVNSPDCSCDSGWQRCPDGAGGPNPPKKLIPSSDYVYNMTGRDISDWLVKTMERFRKRRYGGFSFGDINPIAQLNSTQVRSILDRLFTAANNGTPILTGNETVWLETLDRLAIRSVSKVWYNNKGWIAVVSYMNVLNNMILRSHLDGSKDSTKYGITTINHPMELTKAQLTQELLYNSAIDVVIAICIIFAMSFVPASFTMVLIEERASNSKHLQFVSGVNPVIYWVSNFCWDMLNYLVPSIICILIFLAFQRKAYVGEGNFTCLVLLMFLYGWAMIPLMYPFSRLFSVPSTAMVTLKSVNIFLGTTATLSTYIIQFLESSDEELKNTNNIIKRVFLVLPQYCLGRGLIDMSANQAITDAYAILGENVYTSPFEFDQVGRNLLAMFLLGIFFFILNLLIEYNFFISRGLLCCWNPKAKNNSLDDEDVDVAEERKRILSGNAKDDILRIQNLTKVYRLYGKKGRNTAVDHICVGVPKGQCFGLLGVNGAGKTTTFKMLTGDVDVTKGNAFLNDFSILKDMVQVRRNIGYCPQFDAFDPLLTGREILSFYARLRGISESDLKNVTEWGIRKLGLLPYADKLSGSYSGGNKRKLSTSISLIGNPQIIFLDEPTTGMDPRARRFLWNCINNIVKDGRSVILTSHSMEECEALCGRLGIMVNGRFRCMGSIQHLKNRFGDGYTIIVRVSGENPDLKPVEDYINSTFRGAELREKHQNMLQYQFKSSIKLSYIFGKIEAVRDSLKIEDYSVSQTTLDQVFINFAKEQTDLLDDEKDLENKKAKKTEIAGVSGETDVDAQSTTASTVELDRISGIDHKLAGYTDEESLAGSTVDLIRPSSARSSMHSNDFPNVQIF